ncbi:HlyD family type I secretion periplasmic adaptor subunit [Sphingomicrobium astaxanthinifaciens]|uniref:HlyD family type I secretion periplasmic adaptor subunit n=1 Tax=Sphingomicrobium astaxanthinifaciens TaxID=1227949 RepID=UPI001FCAD98E|nr:HlyD family type I secretion periplasmic adaptor subunit [Sphingomicrobium astaxanthinifaciens]MCJ7420929.1 HlyD family type I secretion periplasmic adaptor subunit [Sphingomicrobium astaxanthinifaciens]
MNAFSFIDRDRAAAGPPRSAARTTILLIAGAFAAFLLWAGLIAEVDEVTRGPGQVIPSSKVQLIQASEPAIVEELLVRSGERVEAGQLLARLDDTQSASALGEIAAETRSLEAREARLRAEGTGAALGCEGADCQIESEVIRARRSALNSRVAALNAQARQAQADAQEASATISSLTSSLRLARENVGRLEPLAARGIVPQTDLADARREVIDLEGRIAAAREQRSRAQAAVAEANAQAAEARADFRQQALDERSQVASRIAVNRESLRGAEGRLARTELRSPVDGVVNNLAVTTIGGFVQAGESVMEVVPVGDKLLVETRVKPSDIAFVAVGDKALVTVTAYDFSIYGGLDGKVVEISADSIYDEVEREAYFNVIVETEQAYLESGATQLPITPGMMTDTQIITGRKSVLAYLLKPFNKARSEALRER